METQENGKSEKGGGGGGLVVVVWGGGGVGGRQQLTSQGISQGWLIQCDQRKILIFK